MIVSQYTPGDWLAVVSDGSLALLPAGTDPAVVAQLWANAAAGSVLTRQLEVLVTGGITSLPPFALVSIEGSYVRAIMRGGVEVELETPSGRRMLGGADVSTWTEENASDALAVTVRVPGHARPGSLHASSPEPGSAGGPGVDSLPVAAGVVRAAAVRMVLRDAAVAPAIEPAIEPVVANVVQPTVAPVVARPVVALPVAAVQPVAAVVPAATVLPFVQSAPPAAVESVAELVPADGLGDLEYTVLKPKPKPADVADPAPARKPSGFSPPFALIPTPPASGPSLVLAPALTGRVTARTPASGSHVGTTAEDHDGLTTLSADIDAIRRALPAWSGDLDPAAAPPQHLSPSVPPARIVLSSGLEVSLVRPVLIGRAPAVSRVVNSEIPRLVTVASPNQDISRTHAEVRMDGEDVLVTDLLSTNGVLVLRPGAGPLRLHPGEPTVIEPGVVVDLGEGISFRMDRGA